MIATASTTVTATATTTTADAGGGGGGMLFWKYIDYQIIIYCTKMMKYRIGWENNKSAHHSETQNL